jgi:hypothetical protein
VREEVLAAGLGRTQRIVAGLAVHSPRARRLLEGADSKAQISASAIPR